MAAAAIEINITDIVGKWEPLVLMRAF